MKTAGVRRARLVRVTAQGARRQSLGKLVYFDKRGRRPKGRIAGPGGAQIYLFTGVRYERDGTPVPGKPGGTIRAKRKRV